MIITEHAIERYLERIDGRSRDTAIAAIASAERAVDVARSFGANVVRLGNGAKLVLVDDRVVTVLHRRQINFGGHDHAGPIAAR